MSIRRAALAFLAAAISMLACFSAQAGRLTRADLERAFPPPFILGEKDDRLPIWPIFKQNATENQLVAYVYESVDLAPIPGFSGTPIDLLVALAPDGAFLDVKVVHFHEPVFVDGLGPEPLFEFVKQYQGKSLKQTLKVGPPAGGLASDGAVAIIDGVAKATASVRILNETLIASGLKVAREKLGFVSGRDPAPRGADQPRRVRQARLGESRRRRLPPSLSRQQSPSPRPPFKARAGTGSTPTSPPIRRRRFHRPLCRRTRRADARPQPLGDQAFNAPDRRSRRATRAVALFRRAAISSRTMTTSKGAVPTRLTLAQIRRARGDLRFRLAKAIRGPRRPAGDLAVFVIRRRRGWDPATRPRRCGCARRARRARSCRRGFAT